MENGALIRCGHESAIAFQPTLYGPKRFGLKFCASLGEGIFIYCQMDTVIGNIDFDYVPFFYQRDDTAQSRFRRYVTDGCPPARRRKNDSRL